MVPSRDGTPIAFWKSGSGPALLLIHGATADHTTTWQFVRAQLEARFTCYAMDRRGRGGSGDGADYALAREAEDVAAVAEAIGEPVGVVGHSFGSLVALEAALLTPNLHRLILYEGVPLRGGDLYAPDALDRLDKKLETGDLDGMLESMFLELVEMPAEEVEFLRNQGEAWDVRRRNAATLPRELRAEAGYVFRSDRFGRMDVPTLLLVGEDSPPRELANATGVAAALPYAELRILAGQRHGAMYTAPDLFVEEIARFLESPR